jgi:hypothetical protein
MTTRTGEGGSALLLAILATAILGAGLMSVLALSGSERRGVMNQQAQTDAFAVAQTGLEQFAANRAALGFASTPAAAYESTRVNLSGGYADVVLQRLRPAVGSAPAMYVLRSTGYTTNAQLSGTPVAERQVSQLVRWSAGGMSVQAAFTGIMGITKNNTNGTISGSDNCGVATAVAGVAVPSSPGYVQSGSQVPTGSPAILSYGSVALAAAAVRIDWNGIVNGTAVTPTVTLPGGTWPFVVPERGVAGDPRERQLHAADQRAGDADRHRHADDGREDLEGRHPGRQRLQHQQFGECAGGGGGRPELQAGPDAAGQRHHRQPRHPVQLLQHRQHHGPLRRPDARAQCLDGQLGGMVAES